MPSLGGIHERTPDASTSVRLGHHQAQVGDVLARRMGVAGQRDPADDAVRRLGDEDGRVGVAPHRAQIAPLLGRESASRRS